MGKKEVLNENQRKILEILLHEKSVIRIDYGLIHEKTGIPAETVVSEIHNLRKKGILKGYSPVIDYTGLVDVNYWIINVSGIEGVIHPPSDILANPKVKEYFKTPDSYILIYLGTDEEANNLVLTLRNLGMKANYTVAVERTIKMSPYSVK